MKPAGATGDHGSNQSMKIQTSPGPVINNPLELPEKK